MRIVQNSVLWAVLLAACSGTGEPTTDTPPVADADADAAKAKKPEPVSVPAPPDVAAAPGDATKTASGLAWKVLSKGTGTTHPTKWSRVNVNYTGWTTDGKMIETTTNRGRPASIGTTERFPGWTEAMQLLVQGDKARFWFPQELAHAGAPGRPQGMLVYDVELVSIIDPPAAPEDVAAPPADATKTSSGLAYKVIKPGTGDDHPSRNAKVIVNFTGWTPDGQIADSSVAKGRPQTMQLADEFPGWTEAIQLMKRGEKTRFWIPERLVRPGTELPKGDLVYEIELLTFDNPIPPPEDVAAPPADAKKTASGLAYKVLEKGTSREKPPPEAIVTVNYTGWTTDGKMFDSSTKRGKSVEFPLDRVIAGWTEGLQLMSTGEKTRFWIPEELAYKGQPGKPAGMLVFDVELVSWKTPPPPIPAPPDVAAPPADATKTASGLAYKVLTKGTGTEHPEATSRVQVHYTGWTTDGKMFDSSVQRGQPATFGLNQVIAGWTEGVQLMAVGDKYRLWIPQELAYKGAPNKPAGMLVFEVELLEIQKGTPPRIPPGIGKAKLPPPPKRE